MNKYILDNVKQLWRTLLILGGLSIIATWIGIILPYYNGVFVDVLINNPDIQNIVNMALIIIFFGFIDATFSYIYNIIYIKLLNKVNYRAKMQLIEHLRRISFLKLLKLEPVYLNQRINIDVMAVFQFFIENYITVVLMIVAIFIEAFIVFHINILIGVLVVLFVPIYVILYLVLKDPLYKRSIKNKEEQNIFFHKINDQFALIKNIKINADFKRNNDNMDTSFNKYLNSTLRFSKISYLFTSCDSIVSLFFRSVMYIIAGYEIVNKQLTVGEFTMVNAYFTLLIGQIRYFFNLGKKYQDARSSYDRIKELQEIPLEDNGIKKLSEIDSITLQRINFKYESNLTQLLKDFNYSFERGKIYGIIGTNGAGKTTLLNILIGIINENVSGNILYNMSNSKELDMYYARSSSIAVMSQDFNPGFDVSVADLLRDNSPCFGIDSINQSLEEMGTVKELFIGDSCLPDLWMKKVKDLSGGEKQKVNLLWCLLKRSNVLVLDEPTASIDKESVSIIKKILKEISFNKIVILVSHDRELVEICTDIIDLNIK